MPEKIIAPEIYQDALRPSFPTLPNRNGTVRIDPMEQDTIKKIENSIVEIQKILIRTDERLFHVATKEETQKIEAQVSHAATKDDLKTVEMAVLETKAELKSKIGWGALTTASLGIVAILVAIIIPFLIHIIQMVGQLQAVSPIAG